MNMFVFVLALTAIVLGIIGMLVDSWDWIIPIVTVLGIVWCYVDAEREEKEMAHRMER